MEDKLKVELEKIEIPKHLRTRVKQGIQQAKLEQKPGRKVYRFSRVAIITVIIATSVVLVVSGPKMLEATFNMYEKTAAFAAFKNHTNVENQKRAEEMLKGKDILAEKQKAAALHEAEVEPTFSPGPDWKSQILPFIDDPLRNHSIFFTNGVFIAEQDGSSFAVEVGSLVKNQKQGVILFIKNGPNDGGLISRTIMNAPEGVGGLTVEGYKGHVIRLSSKNGKKLTFDIDTESFEVLN
jgi:hypothetical protein